ncbi:flavin-containing monooxygenase [Microbacterium thalassium]|uniref:Cation diffusion facilitator CzcD-associated flavoprotein CzcO n=1 Tax=Microbacterium thalassium TaxID=362649 RepID=A0A7X0FN72_9MICO|nr:NAD(P)/FAD-dependent oxidoreductase [Microbacterium thalassium]MBB6390597.1 cation diffusion facilitator CzcD-associated flavoprotein CzcO [Microbacterium thalassium]GLK25707.1 monooxygenase [Microbacterium thalassium]
MSDLSGAPEERAGIIIVGSGFSGIGLGIRLLEEGESNFVILERAQDVGGTWRDNVYPGVACDVPSLLYSYSFRPESDWSRVFAPGGEIWRYLQTCAREGGLLPHLRFGADVERAEWDEAAREWIVRTPIGVWRAPILITAMGHLADANVPQFPGQEEFAGEVFHSAQWDPSAQIEGKRVGVVGAGASAIQIVPRMAEAASEVVVFQRSAAYVIPREDRPYTDAERRRFARVPGAIAAEREEMFWANEANFAQRRMVEGAIDQAKDLALGHLADQVADPELRAALTPDYEIGCKRVLISNEYFPSFTKPNVTLETSALSHFDGTHAVAASGEAYELDVVVLATGFEAARPPFAPRIVDGEGRSLADAWENGMRAHQSITVAGFPNLLLINGPNTGLGHNSVVFVIESQIEYVLGVLRHLRETGADRFEVTSSAEAASHEKVLGLSKGTVWIEGGCRNWYVDPITGELTVTWPDFAYAFREENGTFHPEDYVFASRQEVLA